MNSNKSLKVTAYHATIEEFYSVYNSNNVKFRTGIENYNIYHEAVLAIEDIKNKLNSLLDSSTYNSTKFEEEMRSLSSNLCRVIYNERLKCLFFISENVDKWANLAKRESLNEWIVINDRVIEKLKNGEIENISAIGMEIVEEDNQFEIVFHGEKIECHEKFTTYLKNMTSIIMLKKKFEKFEVELCGGNYFMINTEDIDINLRKNLTKVISIGE